ncbi:MAG: tetratricopeptide repeat protein, partial [Pyrinomonadaceae bacterium]
MMDADGSNQTNVSRSPSDDARPAWSPDGKFLVFAGTTPDEPLNYDIHVIRVDGSDRRRLTDDPGVDTDPAWSPDGSRIVFASDRDRKSYEIYAMTPDGGDLRNLTNHPGSDVKPVWSPDGRRIAFAANRPAKIDLPAIYVMNADGSQQKLLTGSNTFDDEPAWSPDSRRVAFQSERDGNYEIYVANARVDENESGRTAAGRAISLAVLPFTTVGAAGGDAQYLGVGLADLLTNKLGQLKQINCRTSGAVRRYLGSPQSPLQAGRELGVEYILTGAVERSSDQRVLTSLELTDVAAGRVLWAEKFNENAADIFSLQNAISDRIVRALSLQLTNDERERLTKRYTDNGEAHQLYLAGRYHWGKRTPDGLRLAISNFEQAIAKDARFALAYSGLADCHALLNWYMEPPPPDAFARAEQAALRAVELDDTLAEAHVSRAFVTFHYKRDWRAAEQRFRRAIAINPNYATAHHWYAFTLSAAGRHDEAIAEARRAQEIDPRSAVITTALANVFYHARRFDESVEQCMKALELDPGSIAAHVVLRWVYERQGRADAALAAYEKERAFAGETPTTRAKLAHVLAASGRRDEARKVLGELLAKRKQQWVTPYEIAVI